MTDNNVLSCKIVLLGESGVGKTCIISRYINQVFEGNTISTNGASYAAKTLHFDDYDKSLKVEIWDTAGQEQYRSLTKIFYKDATAAILVYDITRKKSFDEIKNYWYKQLLECAPSDIVVGLAGNKADLFDREQVSEEEAKEFAKEIKAIFRPTSAMTASGIDELFSAVGKKILDPDYDDEDVEPEPMPEPTPKKTVEINTKERGIKLGEGGKEEKKKEKCCGGKKE